VQGPNIRPSSPIILLKQEQPFHPLPFVFTSFPVTPASSYNPSARRAITRQEEPKDRDGYVELWSGVQGPNVKWSGDTVITRQEQPDFKTPFYLQSTTLAGLFKTTSRDYIFITQQQLNNPYPNVYSG